MRTNEIASGFLLSALVSAFLMVAISAMILFERPHFRPSADRIILCHAIATAFFWPIAWEWKRRNK